MWLDRIEKFIKMDEELRGDYLSPQVEDMERMARVLREQSRALSAAKLAYKEMQSVDRDSFGTELMCAYRILNDIFFKNLFDLSDDAKELLR